MVAVSGPARACPRGMVPSGGRCVQQFACPLGQVFSGDRCVPANTVSPVFVPPSCPRGEVFSGGRCVPANTVSPAFVLPVCQFSGGQQAGAIWSISGGQCVPRRRAWGLLCRSARAGEVFSRGRCRPAGLGTAVPVCPRGEVFSDGRCGPAVIVLSQCRGWGEVLTRDGCICGHNTFRLRNGRCGPTGGGNL